MIGYLPKEWLFPAFHPKAGVPIDQKKVATGSVRHETTLCFLLHTQENAVMKDSHLAGSNSTMHVVFFQMLMEQFE